MSAGSLRVGYDLTALPLDRSGSARVVVDLRDALAQRADLDLSPLAPPPSAPTTRVVRGLYRELKWYPSGLPRQVRRLEIDVLHCPIPLAPRGSPIPLVVTVHDAMQWDHPDWFPRMTRIYGVLLAAALRRATRVLTPSTESRRRLLAALDLDPERVDVTPYGVDERFSPGPPSPAILKDLGVPQPYLFTVGTFQPRKNLEATLGAFERLADAGADHHLVVAGARGWSDDGLVARLERARWRSRIHLVGRVSDDSLVTLYRGADCFVFPSRGEGFGLPPLEAMACGTPVVASRASSIPEVVGDAGLLVDPDEVAEIAGALERVVGSPSIRAELVRRGRERALGFTWARCAELTVAAYRRALGEDGTVSDEPQRLESARP
jgi:glycosyltransferase involved in cell wall biosynthesis